MKFKNNKPYNSSDLCYIAIFVALTVVCSWISIPTVVPFTLQLFAVFLSLEMLGGNRGSLAISLYIWLGALGLPVFSGFKGGVSVLFSPGGGFIIGFILIALLYLFFTHIFGSRLSVRIASLISGLAVCYVCGAIWFICFGGGGIYDVFMVCILPFIIPDILKLILAVVLAKRLSRIIKI